MEPEIRHENVAMPIGIVICSVKLYIYRNCTGISHCEFETPQVRL